MPQRMANTQGIEILAPVGSYESLAAAINSGCDSVYFGITQLNMRAASANNFDFNDLEAIATTCHKASVRCYLTLNTILYDHDLKLMRKIIEAVKEHGVDAIIASDMAAVMCARELGVEAHISTQMSISNVEAVRFFSQYSDRVVLARELNLNMVKKISQEIKDMDIRGPKGNLVEIEAFIHGAMCVAVSGRCGMSLFTQNSSANRGACKQNCRRKYTVTDDEGNALVVDNEFVMSPKDLCTIGMVDKIIDAGIKILKIEGRGRSAEYVSTVVACYREALDSVSEGTYSEEKIEDWNKRLGTVYNRGLGTGYYMGKEMDEWAGTYGSQATKEKYYIGNVVNFFAKSGVAVIEVMADTITLGEDYLIIGPSTGSLSGKVIGMLVNDQEKPEAIKGDTITLKVSDRVRVNDKFYAFRDVKTPRQQ
jgi:U32 family peptidase